jgi:hypothetical protein
MFFPTCQAFLKEALAPHANHFTAGVQALSNLIVGQAIGGMENHSSPNDLKYGNVYFTALASNSRRSFGRSSIAKGLDCGISNLATNSAKLATHNTLVNLRNCVLRAAAAWDLLYLGLAANDAVPSLISALQDDEFFVRLNTAAAIGHIGPEAAPAIPALIQALTNQHRGVRFNSVYSLSLLGPLAKDAVPALKNALKDSDPEVRTKVLEALQKIDPATSPSAR